MSDLRKNQEQSNEKLREVTAQSRLEMRELWDKLLTIVLGILGFSLTLFSTDSLSSQIINSSAKYYLLISWILYTISLLAWFVLMKQETQYQLSQAITNSLYFLDKFELVDNDTFKAKKGKEGHLIALELLHSKRVDGYIPWSSVALADFENYKSELLSYKLVENPDNFYSNSDAKFIIRYKRIFYGVILFATISLLISVSMILI